MRVCQVVTAAAGAFGLHPACVCIAHVYVALLIAAAGDTLTAVCSTGQVTGASSARCRRHSCLHGMPSPLERGFQRSRFNLKFWCVPASGGWPSQP
jgi:hypothetical protein